MGLRNSIQEMALPLRDKLRKSAGLYLEPEEQIQAVFLAKRPEMQYNDRAVVATDQPKNSVARAGYASLHCQKRSR